MVATDEAANRSLTFTGVDSLTDSNLFLGMSYTKSSCLLSLTLLLVIGIVQLHVQCRSTHSVLFTVCANLQFLKCLTTMSMQM